MKIKSAILALSNLCLVSASVMAGEPFLGYVQGAEALPEEAQELYFIATLRTDKGAGIYEAIDWAVEYERGISDRFTAAIELKALSLRTSGLLIEGYLPEEQTFAFKGQGVGISGSYMVLSPALDPIGLAVQVSLDYAQVDSHSGQDKDTLSLELDLLLQKFYFDGQLVWMTNLGVESTYAKRKPIADLPDDFEWPTDPEMEIELKFGTGVSYRFARNWYVGAEALFETEFETDVGQERWSWFGGPSIHYGSQGWWATLTYLEQLAGGGEQYPDQRDTDRHLIEKTKREVRLKIGLNF